MGKKGGGSHTVLTLDDAVELGERPSSPRSLEACLRTGIEPDELLPKSPKDFWDRKGTYTLVAKEAATLRYQHFEQLRQAKLEAVRRERDAILAEYEGGGGGSMAPRSISPQRGNRSTTKLSDRRVKSAGPLPSSRAAMDSPEHGECSSPALGELGNSTMVQLEERRLARMKLRQKKEIQGVIEMEANMAKIQQENARRTAEDARKKLEYHAELRAKRAQLMAQKHEREIQKKKQEDLEAQQRKLRAKQEAEKEKQLMDAEAKRDVERKREALLREIERNKKAEEFRLQTEALLQQQEDLVAANRQRMQEKERQVQEKMELANKKRHLEAIERRERANARIHHAAQQNQLILQKRKEDFHLKQDAAAERAREIQRKTIQELRDRALQQKKEEEIRQKRLEAARKHQEDNVTKILSKRYEMDQKLSQVYLEREKERMLHSVEKELSQEEKLKNVERLKRVDEYNRQMMLQRIAEEDARSRMIKEKKAAIMKARQRVALDSMIRKHKINHAMEQLRQSNKWDKIEETLHFDEVGGSDERSPSPTTARQRLGP